MIGEDTTEVRVLDLADLPFGDGIADDEPTARVLVDFPSPTSDTVYGEETPEKTINIQQGGIVSRVRIKLRAPGGSWGAAKWRIVRHHGTLAIRVDIASTLPQLPKMPVASKAELGSTPEDASRWILWVVLERNQQRETSGPPSGGSSSDSDTSRSGDNTEDTQTIHLASRRIGDYLVPPTQ